MSRLPILSYHKITKALNKLGYEVSLQRGSHIRLYCNNRKSTTIPNHRTIGRSLLKKILRDIELSPEEFIKLL